MTDGRRNNGSKPRDITHLIGTRCGTRTITGIEARINSAGCVEQTAAMTCDCGYRSTCRPSLVEGNKSRRCKNCLEGGKKTRPVITFTKPTTARHGGAHKPTAMLLDGESVTVCSRCWMQPGWPGWGNPCGKPVVSVKRAQREAA